MLNFRRLTFVIVLLVLTSGCATRKDIVRLEGKLDQLIAATNRSTLEEIFGAQSVSISQRFDQSDEIQKQHFEELKKGYQQGAMTLEEVREKMLVLLGGGDRNVYTPSGIIVRNLEGERSRTVPNGTAIKNCRKLATEDVPPSILEKTSLSRYNWGLGEIDEQQVLFPWELTLSTFTKEIVENTAKRTAQEFIKMGGDSQWNQPIYIKIETEESDNLKVTTGPDDREIHLLPPDKKAGTP